MIWPIRGVKARKELCLIVSRRCNLNCSYCYVDHSLRDVDLMPLEVAQRGIRELFSDPSCEEVEISFLGGEPLMAFDRIVEIAQWVMEQKWEKPYIMFATVNGTLLDDRMKQWFTEHREQFYLCVSYDGKYHAQDVNRSNSNSRIDLDFFAKTWPEQPIKMTLSEEAVPYFAKNVIELHEKNILMDVSLALGTPRWRPESVRTFRKQLDLLADYYLTRPEITPIAFLQHDLRGVFVKKQEHEQFCGAGKQFTVLYMDGSRHPCHLLSPLVLSPERMKEAEKLDIWHTDVEDLPVCSECLIRRFCAMCIGMNFKCKNDPAFRDMNSCLLTKQQILACCRFQTLLINKNQMRDESDAMMARAILLLTRVIGSAE